MITINGNTIININTVDKTDIKHLRNSKELKEIKKLVKIRDGSDGAKSINDLMPGVGNPCFRVCFLRSIPRDKEPNEFDGNGCNR